MALLERDQELRFQVERISHRHDRLARWVILQPFLANRYLPIGKAGSWFGAWEIGDAARHEPVLDLRRGAHVEVSRKVGAGLSHQSLHFAERPIQSTLIDAHADALQTKHGPDKLILQLEYVFKRFAVLVFLIYFIRLRAPQVERRHAVSQRILDRQPIVAG